MTDILPGLCSVTLRASTADEVIELAAANGIGAIEWGGDVHVPPGDVQRAEQVARRCAGAGIDCTSYGSYHFAGQSPDAESIQVLDTAAALGATNVRVWCPFGLGPDASPAERTEIVGSLIAIAATAAERGLTVSLEFHVSTLTETAKSALAVLEAVGSPNLFTYWQPVAGRDPLSELSMVADDVSHLHVFRWRDDGTRLPLDAGSDLWPAAFSSLGPGRWARPRVAFLEFVRDDDPRQLVADAATLRGWL